MHLRDDLKYYAKLAQYGVGYVSGQVELTSSCFQKCAMCESWRDDLTGVQRGMLTWNEVQDLFFQLEDMPTFEHLALTGGDPQAWPRLDDLLEWYLTTGFRFKLQLNTALVRDVPNPELWRRAFMDIRVSLDGATERTYQLMRGDKRDPKEIVERIKKLAHPRVATNTCVSSKNLHEVGDIIKLLDGMEPPLRKAMFLAVLGDRDNGKNKDEDGFRSMYQQQAKVAWRALANFPTSFQEDVMEVRDWCNSAEAKQVACAVGKISFHIKATGDVFPCCLTGGEAIQTRPEFVLGNIRQRSLADIQKAYVPQKFYGCGPCSQVCEWKQAAVNKIVHEAGNTTLAMP